MFCSEIMTIFTAKKVHHDGRKFICSSDGMDELVSVGHNAGAFDDSDWLSRVPRLARGPSKTAMEASFGDSTRALGAWIFAFWHDDTLIEGR
jgi:hypothetical protein